MKNLITRSISGLIYIAVIVVCVLAGKWSFMGLTILFCVFGLLEFNHLGLAAAKPATRNWLTAADALGGAILITTVTLYITSGCIIPFAVYLLYLLARLTAQLYIKEEGCTSMLTCSLTGQMYIALPLALVNIIEQYSPHLVLIMFVFIWINDTGAYIVGSTCGKRRLFPRISPKKSWEGFWGGAAFCLVASLAIAYLLGDFIPQLRKGDIIALAEITVVFATFGDLVESMIKRNLHVKDFGNIIPGHGGILDRIDSLLFVIMSTLCYLIFSGLL